MFVLLAPFGTIFFFHFAMKWNMGSHLDWYTRQFDLPVYLAASVLSVSIYLPRTEAVAPVRLHAAAQRTDSADVHVPGARILLVEDDPRVRSATVGALEDLDYEPVACAGGAEAIVIFNSQPFDLVITDVIRPEMSCP